MKRHISGVATDDHGDDVNETSRESVLSRFSGRLESVRLAVGRPSYAKLQAIVDHLRPSTISTVLRGKTNPTLDFVLHFVRACATFARCAGHPVSDELVNEDAWRNSWLQVQRQLGALRRSVNSESDSHSPECVVVAFSWAYHKLAPSSQAFFRVLSLYLAPEFNLRTATDLLGIPRDVALRHLAVLIDGDLAEQVDNDTYRIRDLLGGLTADFPTQRHGRAPTQCSRCMARW